MKTLLDPDEIFTAIENYDSDGISTEKAISQMLVVMEEQAKEILTEDGYHPYPEMLTGDIENDKQEWISEALQLIHYDLHYPSSLCPLIILEADNIRESLANNNADTSSLMIAYTRVVVMTLAQNDMESILEVNKYKEYLSERRKKSQEGRSKGGVAAAEEKRKEAGRITEKIADLWVRKSAIPERNRASVIAEQLDLSPQTVRRHLKKANIR
jgi:hypothetical protein